MSPSSAFLALCLLSTSVAAQELGTAGGHGTISRQTGWNDKTKEAVVEQASFSPRFSYTYTEGTGADRAQWIVLTEKEPPLKSGPGMKDRAEARRLWCEKEKTSFVAVKLDAKGAVDLYFLCPANGQINTEMLSTSKGLDSVVVKLGSKRPKRLQGTLRGGEGACSDDNGRQAYCTPQEDYTFDASVADTMWPSIPWLLLRAVFLLPGSLLTSRNEAQLKRWKPATGEDWRWSSNSKQPDVEAAHQGIEQGEVGGEEEHHRQSEVALAEQPVEQIVGIGVAGVEGVAAEFQQAHGEEPVEVLLPPGQAAEDDRERDHVEHVDGDHLPPVGEAGDLRATARPGSSGCRPEGR